MPVGSVASDRARMIVLFWDIDGTLLTTGRAGMIAWNQAVKEHTGQKFDLKVAIRSPGMTDFQIAVRTFELLGVEASEADIGRLVHRYEALLPSSLPLRQGRVLDNVREILEHLRTTRHDVQSLLLTGNTRGGARAKLTYYGLQDYLSDGAFCEDTGPRTGIARRALALVPGLAGASAPTSAIVIGDTPTRHRVRQRHFRACHRGSHGWV